MPLVVAGVSAFVLTVLLVPLVRRAAIARRLVAMPSTDRWHAAPVPHVGGVAMAVPVVGVALAGGAGPAAGPILIASAVMFVVGLADDLQPMRPSTKLVWQTCVAAGLLWWLPAIEVTGRPLVDLALAFAWIVGITNAFNLLDHLDGLAAGIAAIAGLSFLALLAAGDAVGTSGALGLVAAALVGAALGFLVFNRHPASVFMGDGGSHFLGCLLAGLTMVASGSSPPLVAPVAAVPVLLLIPIFEMAFVTIARPLAGRQAFLGGRDHTTHRLVALGIDDRHAALVLYALAAACGLAAVGFVRLPPVFGWTLVGGCLMVLSGLGLYLLHIEQSQDAGRPPLPTEVAGRNRSYEVLLDLVLLGAAYYFAYLLRFREPLFSALWPQFLSTFPIVAGLQLAALWLSGAYRVVWHGGREDMVRLSRGVLLGVAASVIAVLYLNRFEGTSRLVFALDAILAPAFVVSARLVLDSLDQFVRLRRSRGARALIYGAGRTGRFVARRLLEMPSLTLTPCGFIDDDPARRQQRVDGIPVVGTLDQLPAWLDAGPPVSTVIVAIDELPAERFDRLRAICAARNVAVRRMRVSLEEVSAGSASSNVVGFPGGRRDAV